MTRSDNEPVQEPVQDTNAKTAVKSVRMRTLNTDRLVVLDPPCVLTRDGQDVPADQVDAVTAAAATVGVHVATDS